VGFQTFTKVVLFFIQTKEKLIFFNFNVFLAKNFLHGIDERVFLLLVFWDIDHNCIYLQQENNLL